MSVPLAEALRRIGNFEKVHTLSSGGIGCDHDRVDLVREIERRGVVECPPRAMASALGHPLMIPNYFGPGLGLFIAADPPCHESPTD